MKISAYNGRSLSRFRTLNAADFYVEIKSPDDIAAAYSEAKKRRREIFVLGGGSNVFFQNAKIKSAILKNALPETMENLGGGRFKVSSSATMGDLLAFALKNSLDCCYYLASAPCQVGGAIAMNAGSGIKEGLSISDFVESVEFFDGQKISTMQKSEARFGFRSSIFLEKNYFITSAILRLPEKKIDGNPIRERLEWAVKNQDLSGNNCGSLCDEYYAPILKFARFLFSKSPAKLSAKKLNWALNSAENPLWLKMLLCTITLLHKLLRRRLKFEIRIVK